MCVCFKLNHPDPVKPHFLHPFYPRCYGTTVGVLTSVWFSPSDVSSEDAFLHTLSCYITSFSASIDCMPPGPNTSAMRSDENVSSEFAALPSESTARVPLKSSLGLSGAEEPTGPSARGYATGSAFPAGRQIRSDGGYLSTGTGCPMFARDTSTTDKEVRATAASQSHLLEEQESGGSLHRCGAASHGAARFCAKERRRKQREHEAARAEQKADGQGDCRWWLSSAIDGCLLEAVNLTTDMFATKHVDYACGLTSQHLLIVTAGSGVFHVSLMGKETTDRRSVLSVLVCVCRRGARADKAATKSALTALGP